MPEKNQIISLDIHGLGSSGEGVGSFEGMRVFVDGALPGERVKAKLDLVKKTYAKGRAVEIIAASNQRVEPPCPYYDRCGGCQIMHLAYPGQLAIKRQRVRDALERIGGFKDAAVNECLPSPREFGYRNKIQLPAQRSNGRLTVGLFERRTHNLVEIDHCMIHCGLGEEIYSHVLTKLKKLPESLRYILIRSSSGKQEGLVIFVTQNKDCGALQGVAEELMNECPSIKGVVQNINPKDNNVILGDSYKTLKGKSYIHDTICGLTFKVSPASFYQVNPYQAEYVYNKVVEFADCRTADRIVDAYCGVGTLSLILAKQAKEVVGIECVPQAIEDAVENGKRNGVSNCRFICKPTEKALKEFNNADTVILNPPRKGCDAAVIETLNQTRPKRIVYLSCDPATLARDLKLLEGYSLDSIQPFDMFPQTAHVETLVKLFDKQA
jgi:23S rRNA (uracil1939-C5)-methyltransferase